MRVLNPGHKHIAWFDVHAPHQSPLKEPLRFAHDAKLGTQDHFIIGGDFLNLEWASHWNEKVFKEIGAMRLRELLFAEMDEGIKVISEIRKAIGPKPSLTYIPGNHEQWLEFAVYNHKLIASPFKSTEFNFKSDIAAMLDRGIGRLLENLLSAKKFNMKVLAYNEPLQIGKIDYRHGHQFGGKRPTETSARKHPNSNIVFGHHHIHEVTSTYGAKPEDVHEHVAVPPLCELSPGYIKDKGATRWVNGFWVADFDSRGFFDGRVVKVLGGRLV